MAGLGPWPRTRRIAVAVSGGADSLCLAFLAKGWGDPLALIVDHRLRADSADEARLTAYRLAGRGIPSQILTLQGLSRGAGLAARARQARYRALTAAASAAGLSDLLMGHHAADQAETVAIRARAASGPAGLAGMAAVAETPDLRVVRPLLGVPPARLRATLRAHGLPWVEDPSNQDRTAERVRVRQALADPADNGARKDALLARACACAATRRDEEARIAEILGRHADIHPEGFAVLRPGRVDPASLGVLIRALTGAPHAPGGQALARLVRDGCNGTLGGIRCMPAGRLGPGTLLVREVAALQSPVAAQHGAVWDGRFHLAAPDRLPEGVTLGALAQDSRAFRKTSSLPAAILWTIPCLRGPDGLLAVPALGYFSGWTNQRVGLRLAPSTPASGAPFQGCAGGDAQPDREPHLPG
jgi:tRNA(Ile)-lysidine synthase